VAKSRDVRLRAFDFAADVVAVCRRLAPRDAIIRRLALQLVDSAGSVGANLEEAKEAQSKRDFIAKSCIALKEAREARFWLRLIARTEPSFALLLEGLLNESSEIIAMLVALVRTARSNPGRGHGSDA
jgi:four helix bundle protein